MTSNWNKIANEKIEFWNQKHEKAERLWDQGLWSEFFRVSYIAFENKISLFYLLETKQELSKGADILSVLNSFYHKYNMRIVEEREYNKWRSLRNDIAHKDVEINEATAKNAKRFFQQSYKNLDQLLNKYLQPKKEYHGVQLMESEYHILKKIEDLIGEPLPCYPNTGFNNFFGYSERDGFIELIVIDKKPIAENLEVIDIPEFLSRIYIHGDNFPYFFDWLQKGKRPTNSQRMIISVIVFDGEKWSRNVRPEGLRNKCTVKQTDKLNLEQTDSIFLKKKANMFSAKILELINQYGRIALDEIAEYIETTTNYKWLTKNNQNYKLIKEIILSLLDTGKITGHYFHRTDTLVTKK